MKYADKQIADLIHAYKDSAEGRGMVIKNLAEEVRELRGELKKLGEDYRDAEADILMYL